MPDQEQQTVTTTEQQETSQVEESAAPEQDGSDEPLDEVGKKALKKANEEAKNYRLKLNETKEELEKLRSDAMTEQERAIDVARKEGAAEAQEEIAKAKAKFARAKAEALATSKTRDPEVAVSLLGDLTQFVTEDGDVDTDAMSVALDELVEEKEYLAVGDRQPVPGADQGARGGSKGASQLSREQLKTMSPEQITKAESEGRLDKLLGRS